MKPYKKKFKLSTFVIAMTNDTNVKIYALTI